jgi:hypothetical protein
MSRSRLGLTIAALLTLLVRPVTAQQPATRSDSARPQIRAVLRAYYLNYQNQNWDALSAYVLSPKLLERRGLPGERQMADRDRTRGRAAASAAAPPRECPSSASPMIDHAAIHVEGDWAEVSVPRCSGAFAGVDEFRMLEFEHRWRFIYTDMFEPPSAPATAAR